MQKRKSRANPALLPKGAYKVPSGGYVLESPRARSDKKRHIRIIAKHRSKIDVAKFIAAAIGVLETKLANNYKVAVPKVKDKTTHQQ